MKVLSALIYYHAAHAIRNETDAISYDLSQLPARERKLYENILNFEVVQQLLIDNPQLILARYETEEVAPSTIHV